MSRSFEKLSRIILPALNDTIFMVSVTMLLSVFLGLLFATILYLTKAKGLKPNRYVHETVSLIVNIVRSFPFIILVVSIMPFTRKVVGTVIGRSAALVPLTISATALNTRMIENSFNEVNPNLVEAVQSFGATTFQIMKYAVLKESKPAIIASFTVSIINIINTTAVAGSVGAGGLGSVAIDYGYHAFDDVIMYGIVIILICIVQVIQVIGMRLYKKSLR